MSVSSKLAMCFSSEVAVWKLNHDVLISLAATLAAMAPQSGGHCDITGMCRHADGIHASPNLQPACQPIYAP